MNPVRLKILPGHYEELAPRHNAGVINRFKLLVVRGTRGINRSARIIESGLVQLLF
jgi:hypothetical protein